MIRDKNELELNQRKLFERAADSSSEGITISTMDAPDRPLIYVNTGFERLTGYCKEEALGRNCRFLQGAKTDPKAIAKLRKAISDGRECTVELVNYKKDGTRFWNRLSITPIRDSNDQITHYVGIQSDITELRKTRAKLESVNQKLSRFRERITRDLDRARLMQHFLLPLQLPKSEHVDFASLFVPMEEIGGDFFDVLELEDGVYGLLIADVTGHGIPAALLTFMSSTTFKNSAPGVLSTAATITETNQKLFQKMPDDAFVTMFYAIYDRHTHKLTYTQAGHPEAYILRKKSSEIIPLETNNTLVGIFSNEEVTYTESSITLQPGDKLILYTDAISDALHFESELEEENGFKMFLQENAELPLKELFSELYRHGLLKIRKKSYEDDFTLLGLEVIE